MGWAPHLSTDPVDNFRGARGAGGQRGKRGKGLHQGGQILTSRARTVACAADEGVDSAHEICMDAGVSRQGRASLLYERVSAQWARARKRSVNPFCIRSRRARRARGDAHRVGSAGHASRCTLVRALRCRLCLAYRRPRVARAPAPRSATRSTKPQHPAREAVQRQLRHREHAAELDPGSWLTGGRGSAQVLSSCASFRKRAGRVRTPWGVAPQTVRVAMAGEMEAARRAGTSTATSPTIHSTRTPPAR